MTFGVKYRAMIDSGPLCLATFPTLAEALTFLKLTPLGQMAAIVSPEDLRWFEEDKKRQEPHAV